MKTLHQGQNRRQDEGCHGQGQQGMDREESVRVPAVVISNIQLTNDLRDIEVGGTKRPISDDHRPLSPPGPGARLC